MIPKQRLQTCVFFGRRERSFMVTEWSIIRFRRQPHKNSLNMFLSNNFRKTPRSKLVEKIFFIFSKTNQKPSNCLWYLTRLTFGTVCWLRWKLHSLTTQRKLTFRRAELKKNPGHTRGEGKSQCHCSKYLHGKPTKINNKNFLMFNHRGQVVLRMHFRRGWGRAWTNYLLKNC